MAGVPSDNSETWRRQGGGGEGEGACGAACGFGVSRSWAGTRSARGDLGGGLGAWVAGRS